MATYLARGSYNVEGAKGLLQEGGSSRRKAVAEMLEQFDGKLEAFYYGFGDWDVYAIFDVPDATSAAAMSIIVNATGAVTLSTIPLLSPEEIDEACQRSIDYRPPGG